MDELMVKVLTDLGGAGLAAVLMFAALRYVINSCGKRADADRELFTVQFDLLRQSYESLCREDRESHEREIKHLAQDFKICVERMTSSMQDIRAELRRASGE